MSDFVDCEGVVRFGFALVWVRRLRDCIGLGASRRAGFCLSSVEVLSVVCGRS